MQAPAKYAAQRVKVTGTLNEKTRMIKVKSIEPETINGTVVDTGCYMSHDAIGEKHTDCATMCAKNGVPLAIVDAAGKVYMPVAADHKNQNAKLLSLVEKTGGSPLEW